MKDKVEHAMAFKLASTMPVEKLRKIRSIIEDCLRRGASFDEFHILAKEQLANAL